MALLFIQDISSEQRRLAQGVRRSKIKPPFPLVPGKYQIKPGLLSRQNIADPAARLVALAEQFFREGFLPQEMQQHPGVRGGQKIGVDLPQEIPQLLQRLTRAGLQVKIPGELLARFLPSEHHLEFFHKILPAASAALGELGGGYVSFLQQKNPVLDIRDGQIVPVGNGPDSVGVGQLFRLRVKPVGCEKRSQLHPAPPHHGVRQGIVHKIIFLYTFQHADEAADRVLLHLFLQELRLSQKPHRI